jgi:hypothetical protein
VIMIQVADRDNFKLSRKGLLVGWLLFPGLTHRSKPHSRAKSSIVSQKIQLWHAPSCPVVINAAHS